MRTKEVLHFRAMQIRDEMIRVYGVPRSLWDELVQLDAEYQAIQEQEQKSLIKRIIAAIRAWR